MSWFLSFILHHISLGLKDIENIRIINMNFKILKILLGAKVNGTLEKRPPWRDLLA